VFVGSWDRMVFAHDSATGAELWHAGLPTMANGSPITYAVDGRQYVVFGSGASIGGSSWADLVPVALLPELRNPRVGNRHAEYGNGIFVFALDE
jgi:glucose dehydrogenase